MNAVDAYINTIGQMLPFVILVISFCCSEGAPGGTEKLYFLNNLPFNRNAVAEFAG